MKFSLGNSPCRELGNGMTIIDLFKKEGFGFDCVMARLNGTHGNYKNAVSDRVYFVLGGSGSVEIEGKIFEVKKGDLVAINKGESHGVRGNLEFLIVTAPPFNSLHETHISI